MNVNSLLQAMADIPEEYIESALPGSRNKKKGKVISFFRRREILSLAAAAVLLLLTFTLAPGILGSKENPGGVLTANPSAACRSLEEAEKAAGFTIKVPESFDDSISRKFTLIGGRIIDVSYLDAEGKRILSIRKGAGKEDVSGDYSKYPQEDVMDTGKVSVTVKGEEDLIYLAVWQEGDSSMAVSFSQGRTEDELKEVIKAVTE